MATPSWRRWLGISGYVIIGLGCAGFLLFIGLGLWAEVLASRFENQVVAGLAAVEFFGCIPTDEVQRANPEGPPTVSKLKTHPEARLDYPGSTLLKERDVDITTCVDMGGGVGPEHPAYVVVYRSTTDSWAAVEDFYTSKLRGQGWSAGEQKFESTTLWRGREFFAVYEPDAKERQAMGLPRTSDEVFATFYGIKLTDRSYAVH